MVRAEGGPCLHTLHSVGRFLVSLPAALGWVLVLAWMGLIWTLSATSFGTSHGGQTFFWAMTTNLGHAPIFGLLALFLAAVTLPRTKGRGLPELTGRHALLVLLFVLVWGVSDEIHQSHTPGRDASALDVVTDLVGAGVTLSVVRFVTNHAAEERHLRLRLLGGLVLCLVTAAAVTALG